MLQEIEIINLKEVYDELNRSSIFRSRKTERLLKKFAHLIAEKSSFAHKAHKDFNKMANLPDEL